MRESEIPIMLPFAHQLAELDLLGAVFNSMAHCLLIQSCPNLKVLYTKDLIGDRGLLTVGQYCKNSGSVLC